MAKSKWPLIEAKFKEIARMTKDGYLEKDICKIIGIGKTTWEKYKNEKPELSELLKNNKSYSNEKVVNALFKNATGFYYYTDEVRKVKDAEGNESLETVTLRKWSAPQVAAQRIWLNNKCKGEWADNPLLQQLRREQFEHQKEMDERNSF